MTDLAVALLLAAPADRIMVVDPSRTWSAAALRGRVWLCRARLRAAGVRAGDRVTVAARHDGGGVAVMLAARAAGALVLVAPGVPRRGTVRRAGVRGPLVGRRHLRALRAADGEDAWGIATSGSTGAARVVVLRASGCREAWTTLHALQPYLAGERVLTVVPLHHIYGLAQLHRAWLGAAVVVLPLLPVPEPAFPALIAGADVLPAVPSMLRHLLACPRGPRLVSFGGELLSPEARAAISRHWPTTELVENYASTEGGGVVLMWDNLRFRAGAAGMPRPGVEARVDHEGELWYRSPALASRYLDHPDATARRWVDGWLRSGDRFTVDGDGYRFVGRIEQQFKRRGSWVSPERVEAALRAQPGVLQAMVCAKDVAGELVPVAWVVGAGVHPDRLRRALRDLLPSVEVPVDVHVVETLPSTALGKPRRG